MTESEVWCSADALIQKLGPKAAMEAAMMMDKMRARKDQAGYETLKRIAQVVRKLESGKLYAS
jgi:hypothetical protein